MTIQKFFETKRTDVQDTVKKRRKSSMSKKELRAFEEENLKPDHLKRYAGEKPIVNEIAKLTVKLIFPSIEELEKFKQHFNVSHYGGTAVTDIRPLLALIDELKSGRLIYNKKTKKIEYE
jgi:hypothetical protein